MRKNNFPATLRLGARFCDTQQCCSLSPNCMRSVYQSEYKSEYTPTWKPYSVSVWVGISYGGPRSLAPMSANDL